MMRSMNSAVSALRNHQLRMDVIGNNIANVNTIGFKSSRVTFKDSLSQMLRGASGPDTSRGGTNPQQVGLGMDLSSVDTLFTTGVPDRTDRGLDVMVNGEGFFMVSADGTDNGMYYTRAGNFDIDEDGNLVNADGLRVLGYKADDAGNVGNEVGGIVVPLADSIPPIASTSVVMEGNLDARATISTVADPVIARQTEITVIDSLGTSHKFSLAFEKSGPNAWSVTPSYVGTIGGATVNITPGTTVPLTFGTDGKLLTGDSIGIEVTGLPNGAADLDFNIDLESLTQYGSESSALMRSQNGSPVGVLTSYAIGQRGEVEGVFSNGRTKILGQIATSIFANPAGLVKMGGNLYRSSANSGDPQVNKPGTGGNGGLQPGALEMSNVDLGKEFTNMIVTQRGFQANSRIISTTDQMLEELVNLKR
ncbi:flagellar hook protein FlgE [Acetoanaerobium noterae]|uniref:flagellar hook protein FlgE n=1 Tax=Acetoanaerobium noterae TaxID=745369 RepID=UPI003241ECC5